LHRARAIAREVGLHYVYEGNIFSDAASTNCPNCGAVLIRRSWHDVTENRLRNGTCPDCGHAIPGRWTSPPTEFRRASPAQQRAIASKYGYLNL
jgi:pyruvate formate lyase activating enzyme